MPILRRLMALVLLLSLCFTVGFSHAEDSKTMNILLIGTDTYEEEADGRSDTMMLLQIDPDAKEIRLLSFLRDLYVSIPGCGKTRLNAAYYFGGAELLKTTLENNFDVSIDRTVAVNFSLLEELVDEIGGVEVEVSPQELSSLNGIISAYNKKIGMEPKDELLQRAGLQLLNGKQALSYCRIRKIDSDFHRTERQQKVLSAMVDKLKGLGFLDLARLAAGQLGKVKTDLSLWDVNALLPLISGGEALSLRAAHVPFAGAYVDETINGMQVLSPDLKRNKQKIQDFLNEP
ncbi:MAG: LCP family protein [Eubacteriales bacterium]|nr:LCP family protein [Eubacteriales bacterium]